MFLKKQKKSKILIIKRGGARAIRRFRTVTQKTNKNIKS
jgi:hypothetical protein